MSLVLIGACVGAGAGALTGWVIQKCRAGDGQGDDALGAELAELERAGKNAAAAGQELDMELEEMEMEAAMEEDMLAAEMADMDAADDGGGGGGGGAPRASRPADEDSDTAAAAELADLDEEELLDLECELAALMDEQLEELEAAPPPVVALGAAAAAAAVAATAVAQPGPEGPTGSAGSSAG